MALTIVIALARVAGLVAGYKRRGPARAAARVPLMAGFGLLQYAAMGLSIHLSIVR